MCERETSCGDPIKTVQECMKAAQELEMPNSTVTTFDTKAGPAGCFTDQTRMYFNVQGEPPGPDFSLTYRFLKSLCRVKNTTTLKATTETIHACGETRTDLPVYRIEAANMEHALKKLLSDNVYKFALLLKPGNAFLTRRLTINPITPSGFDIVIAGERPHESQNERPPNATELTTHLNLARHSFAVTETSHNDTIGAAVCLQDIHFFNGEVRCM